MESCECLSMPDPLVSDRNGLEETEKVGKSGETVPVIQS